MIVVVLEHSHMNFNLLYRVEVQWVFGIELSTAY